MAAMEATGLTRRQLLPAAQEHTTDATAKVGASGQMGFTPMEDVVGLACERQWSGSLGLAVGSKCAIIVEVQDSTSVSKLLPGCSQSLRIHNAHTFEQKKAPPRCITTALVGRAAL
jgi:hypothetical protein